MRRFFFDYKAKDRLLLDYHGHEFMTPAGALDFAKDIAQDLKHSLSADWVGWSLEVRAADGEQFFSFPIEGELSAS